MTSTEHDQLNDLYRELNLDHTSRREKQNIPTSAAPADRPRLVSISRLSMAQSYQPLKAFGSCASEIS